MDLFKNGLSAGVVVIVCLTGCSGPEATETLRLRLQFPGDVSSEALVVVSISDTDVQRIACGAGAQHKSAQGRLTCEGTVVSVEVPSELASLHVTVKARGYRFVHRNVAIPDVERDQVQIELAPLPPLVVNDDYATGYVAGEQGQQGFNSSAHVVDTELGPARVVKFYIDRIASDDPRVFFQNTPKNPLHYDFARDVLGRAVSLHEFETSTYRGETRDAMAGTLVQYPAVRARGRGPDTDLILVSPIALTFFPSDDLTPEQAAVAHRLIEERLGFAALEGGETRLVYLPAGTTQETQLAAAQALFARQDVGWVLRQQLYGNVSSQILNPGLAYGTLRRLSPAELETTVVSFKDILVLSRLPNALPIVGGTITEELQTPLAHVNVAARARGTPNMALIDAGEDPRIGPLLEKLVRFEVKSSAKGDGFSLREATLAEAQAFWSGRSRSPIRPAADLARDDLPGFEALGFADAISVGAKAANLAELARALGDRAPVGFAIPFHHYDRFMRDSKVTVALCDEARADCRAEGRTAEICQRAHALCLPPHGAPQVLWDYVDRLLADGPLGLDTALREAALDGLRHHIRHIPVSSDFAGLIDGRVSEVFGSKKVRLRSSTNAEDLQYFSGAGLYQSVSAYGSGNKLASSQVRKVWASVWNWRAFEERSFWNIDHRAVQIGVAVNQAISDEAANGVLVTQNIADPLVAGMYVNVQKGELSVTNPEGGALPEIFSVIPAPPSGIQLVRLRLSSLSPDAPILSDEEVAELAVAAYQVQQHFAPLYQQSPNALALDLEFKFHGPARRLLIKQARPYIQGAPSNDP